ncbi:uncharacterized protein LOC129883667 [Solanum dulcamara]|uniref:uncharacterized protein LOC129883667 n=1 Tax=Solanum dulcamara TaxID=45834 RepID=UPI002484E64E|nr:uncharacterized protein LOC129883667 [Solanum dulcamara]
MGGLSCFHPESQVLCDQIIAMVIKLQKIFTLPVSLLWWGLSSMQTNAEEGRFYFSACLLFLAEPAIPDYLNCWIDLCCGDSMRFGKGDSEFDSNFCSTTSDDPMDSLITLNPSHQRFLEDDDAQSCSYEDTELDFKIQNDDNDNDNDNDNVNDNDVDVDVDDDNDGDVDTYSRCSRGFSRKRVGNWNSDREDEDDGGVVEQRWMNNGINRCNNKLKSNVCSVVVDTELKSQKDKDKLFWETCLAS